MRIRSSQRGLTFSFQGNETFQPGTHYRYIIDIEKSEVIIVPDQEGRYKLSRKGDNHKPLVDLRNSEIRNAISLASHMEVEVKDDVIVVHIIKKKISTEGVQDIEIAELFDKEETVTFEISKDELLHNTGALSDMLVSSGMFSEPVQRSLSYVFDTVSLFSGAGLLDLPFHKDDSFDLKFAVDFDKSACETYRKNIGDHIMCMDIRDLEESDVPDADVIIGGPCCQGYSNANRAGNVALDVSKRLLIDDYIRMVKAKKPLMFVVENVAQFVTKEGGKYLERVLTGLSDDYNISYSIVNDNEVGGYTTRKRMILIGSVKAMGRIHIPDIELETKKTTRDALMHVTDEWLNYNDITRPSQSTINKMAQVRQGHNYKDIAEMAHLERHSNVYRRLAENEPACTITNWRKVNLMPPVGNRILSVSEAAALMGLDKKFQFFGSLNDKQQQCGNGVTQALANFAKSIVKNALYHYTNGIILA